MTTKTKQTDEWGNEIEERTSEHEAELRRIRESGETLGDLYKSAGAVRRK